jgi:hypothetical protein
MLVWVYEIVRPKVEPEIEEVIFCLLTNVRRGSPGAGNGTSQFCRPALRADRSDPARLVSAGRRDEPRRIQGVSASIVPTRARASWFQPRPVLPKPPARSVVRCTAPCRSAGDS